MLARQCLALLAAVALSGCGGEEFSSVATGGTGSASGGSGGGPGGSGGGPGGSGGSAGSSAGGSGGSAGLPATGGAAGSGSGGTCSSADLQTDTKNCGACGHDCLGSECAKGMCKPTELATGIKPVGIALDANSIYFADDGAQAIRVMPKTGGSPTTLSSNQVTPYYVAFDAGTVYWTKGDQGALMKRASGSTPVALTTGMQTPLGVAIVGATAYVAEAGTSRVAKVATDGSSKGLLVTLDSGMYVEGLATDGVTVWVSYNATDTIVQLPIAGGTVSTFVQGQGKPAGLAVDQTSVYWVNQSSGELRKKPKAGGAVTTLSENLQLGVGVAVDSQWVYFSEMNGQKISRVAK